MTTAFSTKALIAVEVYNALSEIKAICFSPMPKDPTAFRKKVCSRGVVGLISPRYPRPNFNEVKTLHKAQLA
jgi:hypothetical protein